MPSYEAVDIIALVGILLARLIQEFSAGGGFGSATALMAEHLPQRHGYAGNWHVLPGLIVSSRPSAVRHR